MSTSFLTSECCPKCEANLTRDGSVDVEIVGLEDALRAGWWATEPGLGRVAYGMADQTNRLRAVGQGIVPAVARCAWLLLSAGLGRPG